MAEENKKFEELTFGVAVNELSLSSYIQSITEHHSKLEKILSGGLELPIFLDTNVLLRYYETSLKYRSDLLSFFTSNAKNIVLTYNVQKEFVRNREEVIDRFISSSLTKFQKDFESSFIKGLDNYLKNIKSHLDDFPEIGNSINDIKSNLEKIHKDLNQKIGNIEDELKGLKTKDSLLELISSVSLLNGFSKAEIEILKNQYINLGKAKNKKTISLFPGCEDSSKEVNSYGDYVVFHEIMTYMKEHNTDAVFLTYDSTKGDWIKESGEAYLHYIQIAFNLTGRYLFILDADRYFSDKFNNNFQAVSFDQNDNKVSNEWQVIPDSDITNEEFIYFSLLHLIFDRTGVTKLDSNNFDNDIIIENLMTLNDLEVVPKDVIESIRKFNFFIQHTYDKKSFRMKKFLANINNKLNKVLESLYEND